MSRARWLVLLAAVVMLPAQAFAWDSACREYPDPTLEVSALTGGQPCDPEAGPNTARQRLVGPLDEHRALWEETRVRAGLPDTVSRTLRLPVFTSNVTIPIGGQEVPRLVPVPFTHVEREQLRSISLGELAELPDYSYALWDWALGNETCPLGGLGVDAAACHDFATHMGPVNSSHFLPQAGAFYARYHALALQRAGACRQMKEALGTETARFEDFLQACEMEALAIEAVGQHYLQDAWSSGHMWERWGSPELSGFGGADPEAQRQSAVLVALVSGLIHGSRGVLQKLPEWTSFDVNDAMCAPSAGVELVTSDGTRAPALGDDYLDLFDSGAVQAEHFFSCAASGMREVYEASGQLHGAEGPGAGSWQRVDPTGAYCFGQRATNRAVLEGMGLQFKVAGQQVELPLDGKTVGLLVPTVAQSNGQVAVDSKLKARFRLELMRMVAVAQIVEKDDPTGTSLATGRLGDFLGAKPNGASMESAGAALASYLEPPLPWPEPQGSDPVATVRAEALARTFHRAHVDDWCRVTTAADLDTLKTRAQDGTLDPEAHQASCDVCAELAVRHLRVGDAQSWDTSREPVCHYLAGSPAYVYQVGTAAQPAEMLARAWCGCGP